MALNIKDPEAERLAAAVAQLTGESKTRAIRVALAERHARLLRRRPGQPVDRLRSFLHDEAWPQVPADVLGRPLTKSERESILGIGPDGT